MRREILCDESFMMIEIDKKWLCVPEESLRILRKTIQVFDDIPCNLGNNNLLTTRNLCHVDDHCTLHEEHRHQ